MSKPLPAWLKHHGIPDECWSETYLGAKIVNGNAVPVMPDGKVLNGLISCRVESSIDGQTVMTIQVALKNGQ